MFRRCSDAPPVSSSVALGGECLRFRREVREEAQDLVFGPEPLFSDWSKSNPANGSSPRGDALRGRGVEVVAQQRPQGVSRLPSSSGPSPNSQLDGTTLGRLSSVMRGSSLRSGVCAPTCTLGAPAPSSPGRETADDGRLYLHCSRARPAGRRRPPRRRMDTAIETMTAGAGARITPPFGCSIGGCSFLDLDHMDRTEHVTTPPGIAGLPPNTRRSLTVPSRSTSRSMTDAPTSIRYVGRPEHPHHVGRRERNSMRGRCRGRAGRPRDVGVERGATMACSTSRRLDRGADLARRRHVARAAHRRPCVCRATRCRSRRRRPRDARGARGGRPCCPPALDDDLVRHSARARRTRFLPVAAPMP